MDIFTELNYGFSVSTPAATSMQLGDQVQDRVCSFGIGWGRCRFNNVLDRKCFHGVTQTLEFCFVFQRQVLQGTRLLIWVALERCGGHRSGRFFLN